MGIQVLSRPVGVGANSTQGLGAVTKQRVFGDQIVKNWDGNFNIGGGGGGGGIGSPIVSTDSRVPPGCPYPYALQVNAYDVKFLSSADNAPCREGTQVWAVEGWANALGPQGAAAPPAGTVINNLNILLRWGSAYANSANGVPYGYSQQSFPWWMGSLVVAEFQGWYPFRQLVRANVPVGASLLLTPNLGGAYWFVAGVRITQIA